MRKTTIAALAVILATGPMLTACAASSSGYDRGYHTQIRQDGWHNHRDDRRGDRDRFDRQHRIEHRNSNAHRWNRGDRFDERRAPRYRQIPTPRHYNLSEAPRGHRWVQSGDDAVMVALATGIVAAVVIGALAS